MTYNEKISSYYASNQNLPDIKEIKEPSVFYFGYLLPKYSPLAPILSRFGAQSFENGLYDRYLGHNHVHLTVRLGFVIQHLWLGNFGKCNQGLHARPLRLRYPKSLVTSPLS